MPRHYTRAPLLERFMARVSVDPHTGCWLWTGARIGPGYGAFRADIDGYRTLLAHRVSWRLHRGPVPEGLFVLHECDVRHCVNPGHLFLGTQRDNIEDTVRKGRASPPPRFFGNANTMTVVADEHLTDIRRLAAEGVTYAELGRRYGVRADTISAIVRGRSRRHVP